MPHGARHRLPLAVFLQTSFVLSAATANQDRSPETQQVVRGVRLLRAQALEGLGELKRAAHVLQLVLEDEEDYAVRFRLARLYDRVGDHATTHETLVAVPPKERTLGMNCLLGRKARRLQLNAEALAAYSEALRQSPYCTEAALAILDLGVPLQELIFKYTASAVAPPAWLADLFEAHAIMRRHEYKPAIVKFGALATNFPANTHLLLHLARCHVQNRRMKPAHVAFETVRKIDPFVVDSMDTFGSLLRAEGNQTELNMLSHELLSISATRPEPWVVTALAADLSGFPVQATEYTSKAIQIDDMHTVAYLLKGALMLQVADYPVAIEAFRRAYVLERSLDALEGLVETYLAIPQYKQALTIAKEALQLMQRNSRALVLVGRVLSHHQEGRDRAHKAFRNALTLDAEFVPAIVAQASLYVVEGNTSDAITLLTGTLQKVRDEALNLKLGEIYFSKHQFAEAMFQYESALAINPILPAARAALERVRLAIADPDSARS